MDPHTIVRLAAALVPIGKDVATYIRQWQTAGVISEEDAKKALELRREQMNKEFDLLDKLGIQVTSHGGIGSGS